MQSISVKQGDKGFDIVMTLTNEDGTAFDLTNVTQVRFKMVAADSYRSVANQSAFIDGNPTLGKIRYTVAGDEIKTPGNYLATVSLVYDPARVISAKEFFIVVEKSLGVNV